MDDPFVITTPAQLDEVRNNLAANYILGNDIDMDGIDFQPIGTTNAYFNGCFDGNGYKISNLTISNNGYLTTLFVGIDNGVVKDLGLENLDISGSQFVSGIAGVISNTTIERCYVEGVLSGTDVAGISVNARDSIIRECYTKGSYESSHYACGLAQANSGTFIIDSYSTVNFYVTGSLSGAYAISSSSSDDGRIENCYYAGDIEAPRGFGIATHGTITGCAAMGTSIKTTVDSTGRISNVTNTTLSNNIGYDNMLVAINGSLVDYKALNPTHDSIHGENRTLAQLKQQATYEDLGWDFDNVWAIDEGQSFPYLQCFSNVGGGGGTNPGNGDSDLDLVAFDYVASTEDTVTLKWENLPGAEYYEVEYNGTIETAYTNELMVHGLTPDTEYTFKVRACTDSETGKWSRPITTRTKEGTVIVPGENLALTASASSDSVTNCYEAGLAVDGDMDSRWLSAVGETSCYVELDFGRTVSFNQIKIFEFAPRIDAYALQYWDGSGWVDLETGYGIGENFETNFATVTSSKLRLMIYSCKNTRPSICEIEVYNR